MEILVLQQLEELASVADDLSELTQDVIEPNVYYEHWMLMPAWRYLDPRKKLTFVCIYKNTCSRDNRRLCGFIPLQTTHLELFGSAGARLPISPRLQVYSVWKYPHCYSCTPLIRVGCAKEFWEALLTWFSNSRSSRKLLDLNSIVFDGEIGRQLMQVMERRANFSYLVRYRDMRLFRPMENAAESLRAATSSKTLKKLRRNQRRLAERGSLSFKEIQNTAALSKAADEFISLETSGWKSGKGAVAQQSEHIEFFREVTIEALKRNRLRFASIYLNGEMIAGRIAFLAVPGSFLWKVAYDESFKTFSPGILLEMQAVHMFHDDPNNGIEWCDSGGFVGSSSPAARFFAH